MIVDAHVHLGKVPSFRIPDASPAALLSLMDDLGIERAMSMHHGGLMGDFEEACRSSQLAYEQSAGRLPYCLVYHPLYAEESLACIKKALGRPGFAGTRRSTVSLL